MSAKTKGITPITKTAPAPKKLPQSTLAALVMLVKQQERERNELVAAVCEEQGVGMDWQINLETGTINPPVPKDEPKGE